MMRRFCWIVSLAGAVLFLLSGCTGSDAPGAQSAEPTGTQTPQPAAVESTPTVMPAPTSPAESTPTVMPAPTSPPEVTLGLPDLDAALAIEPAPLGTYIVARANAGIRRAGAPGELAPLEIPVYDEPFGPPRSLIYDNEIDGTRQPIALTNWSDAEGALVLRVIAGGPDDDWLVVQAPTRPHDRFVWVRRNDFEFGHTAMRVEIDLTEGGGLTLFDGDEELLNTAIVHGRDSRPTPVHLTYIQSGVRANGLSPAYGTAILSMASYSEVLGTFGGGGLPSNYLHGTNQPELMGQRVSSGEIRVPNDVLDQIIETITPGTPVLMFHGTVGKETILSREPRPALTVDFLDGAPAVADSTAAAIPQLWHRCDPTRAETALVCRLRYTYDDGGDHVYVTAKPDAGMQFESVPGLVVPVYDVPDGEPRVLVHQPPIGFDRPVRFPLRNPSLVGEPLVLWVLERTPDDEWIRVQAPISPQRTSVWVRAADFEFATTDVRIEIDIASEGELVLYHGDTEVVRNVIVSGRESRPTPLGISIVDQVIDGTQLSPAYGPYVVTTGIYNEVLSTFGSGLAIQLIHGTNQPELMGQRISSGHIRLPNEVLAFMVELEPGLVGAQVITVDSTGTTRAAAIAEQERRTWRPAFTASLTDTSLEIAQPGF